MSEAPAYPMSADGQYAEAQSPVGGSRIGRFVSALPTRAPWLAPLAVLGCIASALAYTELTSPTESDAGSISTCIVKLTTGLDCPGCGGTRAAWYLMHGDLPAAARHHLLFVFAVPFLVYMYIAWAGKAAFGWRIPQLRITPGVMGAFLGAWGVFMVVRNLPWAPFTQFFV